MSRLVLCAILLCFSSNVGAQSPAVPIPNSAAPFRADAITRVVSTGDVIHVVQNLGAVYINSALDYARSTDAGRTWTSTRLYPTAASGYVYYELVAGGSHVHVLASSDAGVMCRTSPDRGVSWLPPVTVCTGTNGSLIVAAEGPFLAVLLSHTSSGQFAYSVSVDAGATWRTTALLQGLPTRISMQIDSARVHVLSDDGFGTGLRLQSSTDHGLTWLPRILVVPAISGDPRMTPWRLHADGDVVLVIYQDPVVRSLWVKRSIDGGASFASAPVQLTSTQSLQGYARDAGVIYVACGGYGTPVELLHSADRGATWTLRQSPIVTDDVCIVAENGAVALVGKDLEFCALATTEFHAAITPDRGSTWNVAQWTLNATCGSAHYWDRRWAVHFRPPTLVLQELEQLCYSRPTRCFNRMIRIWMTRDAGRSWMARDLSQTTHEAGVTHLVPTNHGLGLIVAAPFLWHVYATLLYGSQPHGAGSAGTSGIVPTLHNSGEALLGRRIEPTIEHAVGGAPVCFAVSLSGSTRIPLGGGEWLVQGPLTVLSGMTTGPSGVAGAGTVSFPFALPIEASARGTSLNFQALVLDVGTIDGFSLTNGLEVWLQ